jgi:hypothetical protein
MKRSLVALTAALVAAFLMPVHAAPPENAVREIVPLNMLCTPTLEELVTALVQDYSVYVSMTFEEQENIYWMILENPDRGIAGAIRITPESSCLAFSGRNLQHFKRPVISLPDGVLQPGEEET